MLDAADGDGALLLHRRFGWHEYEIVLTQVILIEMSEIMAGNQS